MKTSDFSQIAVVVCAAVALLDGYIIEVGQSKPGFL